MDWTAMFEIEDGKLRPLPIKLPNQSIKTNNVNTNSISKPKREKIPLQPMKFPVLEDLKPLPIPSSNLKKASVRLNPRKELFKVPPRVSQVKILPSRQSIMKKSSRPSISKQAILRSGRSSLISKKPLIDLSNCTPLINLDEAERIIKKGGRNIELNQKIKNVLFPVINSAPLDTKKVSLLKSSFRESKSPQIELSNSDEEFIRLEEKMENKENENSTTSAILTKMESLIRENNNQFQLLQSHVKQVQNQVEQLQNHANTYEKNYNLLVNEFNVLRTILTGSETVTKNKTLNHKARVQSNKKSLLSSPSYNLRKSTLQKNFETNVETNIDVIRMKKAVDMYNSFRNDCTALVTPVKETPKLAKSVHSSITRSLSRRVQNQCFMLQDTPR